MKYLCLAYVDEKLLDAMSEAEWRSTVDASLDSDERLRKSGHYVTSQALENVAAATTVRVRSGKLSVTDGPFAETKEQLGGFILIEARDLDEAIAVAAAMPQAVLGSIEIRPVRELARAAG
jgi:hypothetical protein